MKKLNLAVLLLGCYFGAFAQNRSSFFVEYLFEQKQISTSLPDSLKERKVPTRVIYLSKGDTTKIDTVEGTMPDLGGSFNFEAPFYMLSNRNVGKMFFKFGNESANESEGNITFNVKTPDTIFYDHKGWYKMNEGSIEKVEPKIISLIKTSETKNILGYKCVKFISSGKDKDKDISFWACKDLPETLIPFEGLKSFGYGILQVDNPKKGSFIKATKITKL